MNSAFSGGQPSPPDYRKESNEITATIITAELEFEVTTVDVEAMQYAVDNQLRVRYEFSSDGGRTVSYWAEVPPDARLQQDFTKLKAQPQTELIQALDPSVDNEVLRNTANRIEWMTNYRDQADKVQQWTQAPAKSANFLPRFERYNSIDYSAPEQRIEKTIKRVYERTIFEDENLPDGTTRLRLVEQIRQVETDARQRIQEEVCKLQGYINRYHDQVEQIGYDPTFDFLSSLRGGEFQVELGPWTPRINTYRCRNTTSNADGHYQMGS